MPTNPYQLRPVSDFSPSPVASTIPPDDRSPYYKQSRTSSPPAAPSLPTRRRPMSPSCLRGIFKLTHLSFPFSKYLFLELDLSHRPGIPLRTYLPPLTGHDLMAMFPLPAPNNFEMRPGLDLFKRRERAFFAQAGKEIVRFRVEDDFPHGSEPDVAKHKPDPRPINGPGPGPSSTAHSPGQSPSSPLLYPLPATRPATRGSTRVSVPVNPSPMFPPPSSHTPTSNQLLSTANLHPPVLHQTTSGLRTPPEDITPPIFKPEYTEDYEPDESWRRPMPYTERRRAGKHTKRVIVRT